MLRHRPFPLLAILFLSATLQAHVTLDSPNGGEILHGGSNVLIQWHVAIGHATVGWDLEYSQNGAAGPWIPIAIGLPPGNIATGAPHSFLWTVPATNGTNFRIRVRQVNTGTSYTDLSDADFSILSELVGNVGGLSIAGGGSQQLQLDAGALQAGRLFIVLGSVSGTTPGIPFGGFTIPLVNDFYLQQCLLFPNQAPLTNSLGYLDATGAATTLVTIPPGLIPASLTGLLIHHAALVIDSGGLPTVVSNSVELVLEP